MSKQFPQDPLKELEDLTQEVHTLTEKHAKRASRRYPLTLSLLGTFGLAAVIWGFEGIVKSIPFLDNHPFLLLTIGIVLLIITGSLYTRLDT